MRTLHERTKEFRKQYDAAIKQFSKEDTGPEFFIDAYKVDDCFDILSEAAKVIDKSNKVATKLKLKRRAK